MVFVFVVVVPDGRALPHWPSVLKYGSQHVILHRLGCGISFEAVVVRSTVALSGKFCLTVHEGCKGHDLNCRGEHWPASIESLPETSLEFHILLDGTEYETHVLFGGRLNCDGIFNCEKNESIVKCHVR